MSLSYSIPTRIIEFKLLLTAKKVFSDTIRNRFLAKTFEWFRCYNINDLYAVLYYSIDV